jgi:hypothetical protein
LLNQHEDDRKADRLMLGPEAQDSRHRLSRSTAAERMQVSTVPGAKA